MREKDRLWLAGYLEGEGSFSFGGTPSIQIDSTDLDALEKAAGIMGSRTHLYAAPPRRGCRQIYKTYIHGDKAIYIMRAVLPEMLSRRSARIKEVLALASARPGRHGSRNHRARLTEYQVPVIRALARQGLTYREIGNMFRVTPPAIGSVVRRLTWKHVTEEVGNIACA